MVHLPVLLITFNRPQYTRKVLETILAAQPQDLYVFQDGAREGNAEDGVKCREVRRIVTSLTEDAHTRVHTFYSDRNLGCGSGPASALDWFFQQVEQGIVLEDDCLPNPDFFPYCAELLEKYKDDERVGFIGGSNYGYHTDAAESYVFGSGHHQTWGWAAWRRTWELFDYFLKGWDTGMFRKIIRPYYPSLRQREYWIRIYEKVKIDQMEGSCWDYQFYFANWKNEALAICPAVNLVENIGNGREATHTQGNAGGLLFQATDRIMPLKHPEAVLRDPGIDDYMMRCFIIPHEYGWEGLKRMPYRLNRRLKRLVNHEGPWIG